ncbi:glycosyltransferase [Parasedimentitalea psychrophila]|uniref:Glycosyltransferase n=1 Tax=Parasedimentitalea psychrophila TaxID=2997337 RepID=A0A9Y2L5F9_9RHOB|nr:glycosyltransferase [Parasedimentitalea psychrophila]WIY27742.1 glycosyltransferase [Parasedimentitalea psychrophila]
MNLRLLYIIDSLRVGGAETLLLDLLDAAQQRGDSAHVAYFTPGPLVLEVARRGVEMTRLSRSGLRDPRALLRAVRLIRAWDPHVVHTHLVKSDLVGQLAARVANRRRVITLHNTDPWRKNKILSGIYRSITRGADACVAVTSNVADHVANCGGYDRDAIEVVQNGVDLQRFAAGQVQPRDLSSYGISKDAVVIAKIGRLTAQKDHDNFLHAVSILAKRQPEAHFLIVGDGELLGKVRERARGLGLGDDRLTFTGNLREMPELLAAIDIFVLASKWEGLPMVLLEAMAMGVPIVSTAVGGVPELIQDGENGMLVTPTDPAALAGAVRHLIADPPARLRLGEAGLATVRARFSGAAMMDRLWSIYSKSAAATAESAGI